MVKLYEAGSSLSDFPGEMGKFRETFSLRTGPRLTFHCLRFLLQQMGSQEEHIESGDWVGKFLPQRVETYTSCLSFPVQYLARVNQPHYPKASFQPLAVDATNSTAIDHAQHVQVDKKSFTCFKIIYAENSCCIGNNQSLVDTRKTKNALSLISRFLSIGNIGKI